MSGQTGANSGGNSRLGGDGEGGLASGKTGGAALSGAFDGVDYGGGGGGGGDGSNSYIGGTGGSGAGNGGSTTAGGGNFPGGNGTPNRGGGGGGGTNDGVNPTLTGVGGVGGSGVFIIRYLTGTATCTGGTVTAAGGFTIHTFTSSGTFTVA
ncbi:MAG: hypothetical protein INF00_07930 [Phenylobacterium sp.]|nr:hypothetical protein [Phenylobacterium sp.]MCA3732277.1 hypothetical protein [Phenylobacterium sp.]